MPRFDGTGPEGHGPRTGRGLGSCGRGSGFRKGFGRGVGMGRGFRYQYGYKIQPTLTKEQEKDMIETEIKLIQEDMDAMKKRLQELE